MNFLPFNLDQALQGLSKATLKGGGVIGKVTFTVCFMSLLIMLDAWLVKNVWIFAIMVIAIFVLAFPMLWRLISLADRHPQAALLEGAEFLAYERGKWIGLSRQFLGLF